MHKYLSSAPVSWHSLREHGTCTVSTRVPYSLAVFVIFVVCAAWVPDNGREFLFAPDTQTRMSLLEWTNKRCLDASCNATKITDIVRLYGI